MRKLGLERGRQEKVLFYRWSREKWASSLSDTSIMVTIKPNSRNRKVSVVNGLKVFLLVLIGVRCMINFNFRPAYLPRYNYSSLVNLLNSFSSFAACLRTMQTHFSIERQGNNTKRKSGEQKLNAYCTKGINKNRCFSNKIICAMECFTRRSECKNTLLIPL